MQNVQDGTNASLYGSVGTGFVWTFGVGISVAPTIPGYSKLWNVLSKYLVLIQKKVLCSRKEIPMDTSYSKPKEKYENRLVSEFIAYLK